MPMTVKYNGEPFFTLYPNVCSGRPAAPTQRKKPRDFPLVFLTPSYQPRGSRVSPYVASHLYPAKQDFGLRRWDFIRKTYCGDYVPWLLSLLPSLTLCTYYSTFIYNCQGVFIRFLNLFDPCLSGWRLLPTSSSPLDNYILTYLGGLVKGFSTFLSELCERPHRDSNPLLMWHCRVTIHSP